MSSGQVVFGDAYYPRLRDEAKIWRRLERGAHLIVLAPRRVGKTSLLRNMERNPREGFVFLYVMVQSCTCEHDFYKEVIEKLYGSDFIGNLKKVGRTTEKFVRKQIGRVKKISIADAGIELADDKQELRHNDLAEVIHNLKLKQKLIIILDEYPDVIERIHDVHGKQSATDMLTNSRTLCQDIELSKRAQFIFTGSIGLDSLANRLSASKLINDRNKVALSELKHKEAVAFIRFLETRNNSDMHLSDAMIDALINKVEWRMPYYLEILWESLEDYCIDQEIAAPSPATLDAAYEQMFSQEYRSIFNHWVERLQRFDKQERKLAKQILNMTAEQSEIKLEGYLNLAQQPEFKNVNPNFVMDGLEHDGYLFEYQPKRYKFTSPILRTWWKRYADRTL